MVYDSMMHLTAPGGRETAAGGLAFAAVMVMAGAALAFDYHGVATSLRAGTQAWWDAGRIRRAFRVRAVSARPIGALTAFVGILIIAAIILQ